MTYRYFGKSKRPYEMKACAYCLTVAWILKEGKFCSNSCSRSFTLEKRPKPTHFHGDIKDYKKYHQRLLRTKGSANKCTLGCIHSQYHWANLTGDYSNLEDYVEMCASCHHRFDTLRVAVII